VHNFSIGQTINWGQWFFEIEAIMRYFVRVSGLMLVGLLGVGSLVGRSEVAIGQPVPEKKVDDRLSSEVNRLIEQGNQEIRTSQYDATPPSYAQALEIYRKIGDRKGEAWVFRILGDAYSSLSRYDEASNCHHQALLIYQEVKDRNREAYQLMKLGDAYWRLALYDKAISYYQQSLPIYREVKDRNFEAIVLVGLGMTYRSLWQHDKAIAHYKQSINLSESLRYENREIPQDDQKNYLKSIAFTYTDLARLLTQTGRSTEAEVVVALLDRLPPINPDGIPLTPAEQQILTESAK
jgi:tetratricopeptide (TPR) repeat protein